MVTEVEIGWGNRSRAHIITGYVRPGTADPRVKTLCGRTLVGLLGNRYGPPAESTCDFCRRRAAKV
jgi:hypothetical protein